MELLCRLTQLGNRPVLHASGEVDLATLPYFHDHLSRSVALVGEGTLYVDLDGVIALDDTGLGILLGAAGRCREQGGDLMVVCTNARLLARLAITGLDRAITVVPRVSASPV